jgi:TetR/AcrR family transcriptional regulator, transcriptional repressor for nem operon
LPSNFQSNLLLMETATAKDARQRPADKRNRIVKAAGTSFHRQGISSASLATIAAEADVPLGNIYYYFPTKNSISQAVIESYLQQLQDTYTKLEHIAEPRARLLAFLDCVEKAAPLAAQGGCSLTEISADVRRLGYEAATDAAALMDHYQGWMRTQLRALSVDDADSIAEELFALTQGAYVMAKATGDEALFRRVIDRARKQVREL